MSELQRQIEQARSVAVQLEQENAYLREQIAAALAVVETDLPEACYHAETMEYEDDPCTRCALRAFLTVPDAVTLDVIASHATQPNAPCPVCTAVLGDTDGCPCCEQWRNGIAPDGRAA